jgi:methionine-S-sulfoxide reductase
MKTIWFAGGCFWGTEHYLSQFEGVLRTQAGYANGHLQDPTYQQVYTDQTGHVECVKVEYDDEIISLATLCRLFFRSIDPLVKDRQGDDCGTRYRTGIYWSDAEDAAVVEQVYSEEQRKYDSELVVEKCPLQCFYPAEEYHQDYLVRNLDGYCHLSLETLWFAKRYAKIVKELIQYSDPEKKAVLPRFFKTGRGEYGEGDRFLGVVVPSTRKVAKQFKDSSYEVLEALLESEWHECRLCALLILIEKYKQSPEDAVNFYLGHTAGINNWDLVDLSAPYILGDYLSNQENRRILYELAGSPDMWEQRISVVSTLMLIRRGFYMDTIELAKKFIDTKHDLIQKAVGWMLREVGKRNEDLLISFLDEYRHRMPRTMLRYAIERFKSRYICGS